MGGLPNIGMLFIAMLRATTRMVNFVPAGSGGRKMFSTLLTVSGLPPAVEVAPEKTLPRYLTPPMVTSRSRSLIREGAVGVPGASVHTSVTWKGLSAATVVPLREKVCPLALKG